MPTRVGRTVLTSALTLPSVATASAYVSGDAVGSAFRLPLAVGDQGGLLAQLNVFDRGTAAAPLRFHFFSTAFTPTPNGDPFAIAAADEAHYLGYVDVGAASWVSAGAAKLLACVSDQNIGLVGANGSRSVWGQAATPGAPTFGAAASPLTVSLVVLQD